MSKAWISLFLAAIFETGWTYALNFMNFSSLKTAWASQENLGAALIPFIAYVFFGGGNIYYLSVALKDIPTSTAIAIWTAVSLVLIKICDVWYFKQATNYTEIFFLTLIVIGIIGMKQYSAN